MLDRRTMLAVGLAAVPGLALAQTPVPSPPSPEELRLRNDWPFLQRYATENAIDRDLPPGRRRVVFIGDSITQGWRDSHPAFFADNGFLGRGISGQVTAQMLVRFWPDVVALKPAAVHVLAGTNDIAQNAGPYDFAATQANLQAMTILAQASGIAVILATVTPAAEFPWRPGLDPAAKVRTLNAWLKAYAAERGAVLADYTQVLDDGAGGMKPGLAYDGVHPTREGYAVMEPVALAAIASALAPK
ncbi:SGNH/GDSL hydrolase family protein [Caulobacter sp. UNC279MFTsu5.1]|uniref:SGNH/GDSL hydrolase family protein n=1 Tax=Caulobacter sp. UNC279MFTsu5.1 TaxID=1502775 RepID=UPI0003A38838|nr:SGNH/GDSL hydrolase family protein [Caulobacter sp. UNC279MFTsu5.1]SFK13983.1 Lysophospholipase L1 [Caulobacter sp. UNC279MFTsu5.1]